LAAVATEEVIDEFGGRLDARDNNSQTPAHICAGRNGGKEAHPKSLKFLLTKVPHSFEVVDANGQKPADIADKEHNSAQYFFAKLRADQKTEEAQQHLEAKNHLLQVEKEVADKCKDSIKTGWNAAAATPPEKFLDVD